MNISRFFGATNREAMRQVRMALGPDALIVSNRRVNGGVEILATDQTSVASAEAAKAAPVSGVEPRQASAPAAPAAPVSPADLMQALGSMRGLLENGFDELRWGAQLRKAPQAVSLFQKLLALGFSTALLRAMLKRLPETLSPGLALQWCHDELVAKLPVMTDEEALWAPGTILALVGPTGVGKTTTIAKMAARCVRRYGASGLVLITTDTYRIGAHEQLKIYGRLMKVPVHVAQDRSELARLVADAGPAARILIDNVGVSQRDRQVAEQAALLSGLPRPVKRLLVLNAASQGDTLDEVARAYTQLDGCRPTGCIVTKLDEGMRIGPALDIAIRYQLPIHYASTGQKVPEDLAYLDAEAWVDQALMPAQPASALFSPSAADLAALMEATVSEPASATSSMSSAPTESMLPGLFALAGTRKTSLDERVLQAACAELEASAVYAAAYRQWRQIMTHPLPDDSWHPLAAARNELTLLEESHLLALHDTVSWLAAKAPQKIRATALFSGTGKALTASWQQWSVGAGWQASDGASGPTGLSADESLRRQIGFLNGLPGGQTAVHLFSYSGQSLLRDLCGQSIRWLAQCAGATRVEVQSCMTTMAAHSKTLDYRCFDLALSRLDLGMLQGVAIKDVALWAAQSPVDLVARGFSGLPLRQVSVRLIDRRDGKVLKALHGLSSLSTAQADLETLTAWLVVQAEAKVAARYLPVTWSLFDESGSSRTLQERVGAAVQMALAVWRAQHAGVSLGEALAALAGSSGLRTTAARTDAMVRLFAMKNLVESPAGITLQ